MIKVTVMLWFELNGEPRFSTWETKMIPMEAQGNARQLAMPHTKGQCKIFDDRTNLVIGSAGFE